MLPKVYICAPFSGNKELNEQAVRWLCRKAIASHKAPFAPTLFYAAMLGHESLPVRASAEMCCQAWLEVSNELWVYGSQGIRPRMRAEMNQAKALGLKIVMFAKDKTEAATA